MAVNFCFYREAPAGFDEARLTDWEARGLAKTRQTLATGIAYAMEHATRPSTIAYTLAASPISLLAWCARSPPLTPASIADATAQDRGKAARMDRRRPVNRQGPRARLALLADRDLSDLDLLLPSSPFPPLYARRSPHRRLQNTKEHQRGHDEPTLYIKKPTGYSWFPQEMAPVPRQYIEATANVTWFRKHDSVRSFPSLSRSRLALTTT